MHINKIYLNLLVAAWLAIIVGTVVVYEVEKGAQNSQMTTLLDALW